ncbi:hypothetical protein PENTCL1PPCAC_26857, partial [Pristionchus entomophagus]
SMRDLEMNRLSQFGIVNELELVLARGAGLFVEVTPQYACRNFHDQWICKGHLDKLSREWHGGKSKRWDRHFRKHHRSSDNKDVLCGIMSHERPRKIRRSDGILNKQQAQKYLHRHNQLFHVGIPICCDHVEEINILPPISTVTSPNDSVDIEFYTSTPEMVDIEKKEMLAAFVAFTEKAKVDGAVTSLNFGALAKDTKMRKVWAMKKIVNVMASLIAPNDEEEFMRLYLQSTIPNAWRDNSDPKMEKIFEEVANQYDKTDDRKTREIILSSIANVIGPTKLQTYIPGLSSRKYHNAKLRARSSVPFDAPHRIIRERYRPERLNYFVSFITSPIVSTGLPYGERKVKTSDGSTLSIPNTIRLLQHAEIIRMYTKHMEQIGETSKMISKSVAYWILKMCSATKRHPLTCVDYYMADGADAFEDIDDILNTLQGMALLDADMAKLWKIRPEKINLYDCALQLYKQKLEGIQTHNNTLKEATEAMTELANGVDQCNEGWALKGKRKHVKYSDKAKNFASKMFRQGDSAGRKMDPAEVERLMKENDQIKPYERMNAQQIRSYFGTLCKEQTNKRGRADEKEAEEKEVYWEDLADEDVENIDDLGRQMDDDVHDLIRKDIKDF